MRVGVALGIALAGLAWTGEGRAQNPLEGLTVKPHAVCMSPRTIRDKAVPPPVIESIYPSPGAVVRPGLLVVRITFNVAMSCNGIFLRHPPFEKPCGEAQTQEFWLSYDRRTMRMKCTVSPNRRYGIRLNNDPAYEQLRPNLVGKVNFVSLAGSPLQPFELTFSTSSGPMVTSVEMAEAQDKTAPATAPELAVNSWK